MTNMTTHTGALDAELRLLLLALAEAGSPQERARERARRASERLTCALVTAASLLGAYNGWLLLH